MIPGIQNSIVKGRELPEMDKIFVKDLKDKQSFETPFFVKEKIELTDKNGKKYLNISLADISGTIDARVWDNVVEITSEVDSGDFAVVKGHVQTYQNRMQVVVHTIKKTEDLDFSLFVKASKVSPKEMIVSLDEVVASISDVQIRQLLEATIQDSEVRSLLMVSAAAKTIHHAYVGGLLEHILSICKLCESFVDNYPFLKRDFLIFGAIYHDIGKIWELTPGPNIQYTDRGRLVGHMQIACELLDDKCSKILGFSSETKDLLKHIILSHHGKLEFGSPKRPKFIEALVVSQIDEIDSRINTLKGFMDSELQSNQKWTKYNGMFDRYFYLGIYGDMISDESK